MSGQKEAQLTGFPDIITYESSKKILEQMAKNICKIKIGKNQGTGFFCKIPFPNKKTLPVLITNNHVIDAKLLYTKDFEIQIDIKEENELKKLNLNNRIKYTNEEYDTTIIEIKKNDNIKSYLEFDDIIINGITNNIKNKIYLDKTVYIIQYPKSQLSVSYGIIDNIMIDKKYEFFHKCSTEFGSSGSPILNIYNNKIIGIHKEGNKAGNINKGTFLNYPIIEFLKKYSIQNIENSIDTSISSNDSSILEKEKTYNSNMLQYLMRYAYFKKELFSQNDSSNIFEGYIIEKNIINAFMKDYNIKEVIKILNNNEAFKEITYQNFNSIYPKINNYLNIYKSSYINSIKQIEAENKFSFIEKNSIHNIKNLDSNANLIYIDNFEIINKELALFLSKTFNNNIDLYKIKYICNDIKFVLAIKYKQDYIYEIASIDNSDNIIIKYLIELTQKNKEQLDINSQIFKPILTIGINTLISFEEPIQINNTTILNIHSINEITIKLFYENEYHEILFDFYKTIGELRKHFFTKIKRSNLIYDKDIVFMKDENTILESKNSISKYINKDHKHAIFVVKKNDDILINFVYNQKSFEIFAKNYESMGNVIKNFITISNLSSKENDIIFLINGKSLNEHDLHMSINEIFFDLKHRRVDILVVDI